MHTFIIAAISADGLIAPSDDRGQASTSWKSKEDTSFFVERTKQAGVVIMGSRTFETIGKPLPGRLTVVYSDKGANYEGVEVTKKPPRELLADLETRGYKEVAICGGASIYTLFMEAGAVDTVYLTVEPVLFGTGVRLFTKPVSARLSLVAVKQLSQNVILLEYKVIHSG